MQKLLLHANIALVLRVRFLRIHRCVFAHYQVLVSQPPQALILIVRRCIEKAHNASASTDEKGQPKSSSDGFCAVSITEKSNFPFCQRYNGFSGWHVWGSAGDRMWCVIWSVELSPPSIRLAMFNFHSFYCFRFSSLQSLFSSTNKGEKGKSRTHKHQKVFFSEKASAPTPDSCRRPRNHHPLLKAAEEWGK